MAYRWFPDYGFNHNIPRFSTFDKNYVRRFKDTDIFEKIFIYILGQATSTAFVKADAVFIDSTHVKANTNKNKYNKVILEKEVRNYQELLDKEINENKEECGKKSLNESKKQNIEK